MYITKRNKEYKKNNYNKNGIYIVIIIIACVTAISTVIETGGFIVTQAQEGEQSPFGPVFPLPTSPSPSPTSPTSPSPSHIVSPEIKAQMCDPNNPKLEFVNSTESEVCGLPKSTRNDTTTSPITPSSPITPPSSPKPITPSSPITPPSSPKPITPSSPITPPSSPKPITPSSPRSITPSQP